MAFDLSEENPLERIKKFMVFINEKNEERPVLPRLRLRPQTRLADTSL